MVDDVDGKSAVDDDIAASESTKGGHKSRSSGRSSGDSSVGKGKSDDVSLPAYHSLLVLTAPP